jgi:hypothetical protein
MHLLSKDGELSSDGGGSPSSYVSRRVLIINSVNIIIYKCKMML